jgi:hypothetical protein
MRTEDTEGPRPEAEELWELVHRLQPQPEWGEREKEKSRKKGVGLLQVTVHSGQRREYRPRGQCPEDIDLVSTQPCQVFQQVEQGHMQEWLLGHLPGKFQK